MTLRRLQLERELGAPLVLDGAAPGRWIMRLGAERARLSLDRAARVLVTEAPSRAELYETFSLLRSLRHVCPRRGASLRGGGLFARRGCGVGRRLGDTRPAARGCPRWAVSLRCAELSDDRCSARLVAGGGIVADSDPQSELAETQAKFQAMLSALVRP